MNLTNVNGKNVLVLDKNDKIVPSTHCPVLDIIILPEDTFINKTFRICYLPIIFQSRGILIVISKNGDVNVIKDPC